ncbi:hypothetical protein [Alcanivorax sp. 1008]|uniref:hypothetical protein n=1 Tax=Alcanivorax sp. 1008 TaxID=2816853 RepID=UPI001E109C13|nr:hypothetical protein [Alcanivorax sp. 1008]MCC1497616.1 hypothetical protein [Alcanivorax sp. 1008]
MIKLRVALIALLLMLASCGEYAAPSAAQADEASQQQESWPLVWLVEEGSCQDTETRVLVENAANLITWADPEACQLAGGAWQSWGRDVQLPLSLTWVVPLVTPAHAVQHGAKGWSDEQKIAFTNDHDNLIILDTISAKERGDLSPVSWVPLERFWCQYATRWQRVKQRYGLTVEEEEAKALARMLEQCESTPD